MPETTTLTPSNCGSWVAPAHRSTRLGVPSPLVEITGRAQDTRTPFLKATPPQPSVAKPRGPVFPSQPGTLFAPFLRGRRVRRGPNAWPLLDPEQRRYAGDDQP